MSGTEGRGTTMDIRVLVSRDEAVISRLESSRQSQQVVVHHSGELAEIVCMA